MKNVLSDDFIGKGIAVYVCRADAVAESSSDILVNFPSRSLYTTDPDRSGVRADLDADIVISSS